MERSKPNSAELIDFAKYVCRESERLYCYKKSFVEKLRGEGNRDSLGIVAGRAVNLPAEMFLKLEQGLVNKIVQTRFVRSAIEILDLGYWLINRQMFGEGC